MIARFALAALVSLCLAVPAGAEGAEEPLPDFASCLNRAVALYERDRPAEADVVGILYCGTLGIVRCDRSPAPYPCQHALAETQEALRQQVLATLPPPEALADAGPLYRLSHALAVGRSAGPDCAGTTEPMEAWCEAHEASLRLADAILTWQLARAKDAAPAAIEAGWAAPPPPVAPRLRPEAHR